MRMAEALEPYRTALARDPANLALAADYWRALETCLGNDLRDGFLLGEAFRTSALASVQGVVELCRASRELCDASGEMPSARTFDARLVAALRDALHELAEGDAATVKWVLSRLGAEPS